MCPQLIYLFSKFAKFPLNLVPNNVRVKGCGYKPLTLVWGSCSSRIRPTRVEKRGHPQNEQGRWSKNVEVALYGCTSVW